jgi:hypothetical protein
MRTTQGGDKNAIVVLGEVEEAEVAPLIASGKALDATCAEPLSMASISAPS